MIDSSMGRRHRAKIESVAAGISTADVHCGISSEIVPLGGQEGNGKRVN
jgi:hypothetical protein